MSLDKKKLGEEELKRALLMMKYDSRKTLSENTNDLILEQTNCPNTYDAEYISSKAFDMRDIIEAMDTTGFRMFNLEGNCKQVYDTIKDLSEHNFYNEPFKTCENSLKRFKEEYLTTGNIITFDNSIEEQIQEILDDYVASRSVVGANYLKGALKLIAENENKLAGGTDQQEDQVSQNAKKCGWLKTDGSADVDGYKQSGWKCPKSGKGGGGTGGGSYKDCTGTYTQGCKSEVISRVQVCLGLKDDGKFGPNTQKALVAKGYSNGFTDADVDKICKSQASPDVPKKENPYKDWAPDEAEGGGTTQSGVEG